MFVDGDDDWFSLSLRGEERLLFVFVDVVVVSDGVVGGVVVCAVAVGLFTRVSEEGEGRKDEEISL